VSVRAVSTCPDAVRKVKTKRTGWPAQLPAGEGKKNVMICPSAPIEKPPRACEKVSVMASCTVFETIKPLGPTRAIRVSCQPLGNPETPRLAAGAGAAPAGIMLKRIIGPPDETEPAAAVAGARWVVPDPVEDALDWFLVLSWVWTVRCCVEAWLGGDGERLDPQPTAKMATPTRSKKGIRRMDSVPPWGAARTPAVDPQRLRGLRPVVWCKFRATPCQTPGLASAKRRPESAHGTGHIPPILLPQHEQPGRAGRPHC